MLKNENIICISSIDWDFIWQGHQEIMSAFAKNGNRVLFIENTGVRAPKIRDISRLKTRIKNWSSGVKGIREEMDNLFIFSPIVLPFPYSKFSLWINQHSLLSVLRKWIEIMNFSNPIIWVFLPTPLSLSMIDDINSKSIVYYCIDNFRVSSSSAKKIENSEIKLLKKADLVFVTSRELYNYCFSHNNKVSFFPFAVNYKQFEEVRLKKDSDIGEFKNIKRPIIGYIGGVHKWVDLNLVKVAAQKYPQYSFVFIGPLQTDVSLLSGLENVYFLGKKGHQEIANFINNFDICIIPYLITDYTKNVYPTKLNEYLAMGKPVISTDLPEIANFNTENGNLVSVGKTYEEFINCIPKALNDSSEAIVNKRISTAKENSWIARIEQMSNLIEDSIDKKSKIPIDWRERFLKSYKVVRRKSLKVAFIVLSIYFLIFHTHLIWFLAKPLKISQLPKKVDCIVTFAGGVGESGKPGQDYDERVQYAVELYKKGYGDYLIFSSGFEHIFKETSKMKALAISLGVPEDKIILENKAGSTYENVKFTTDILKDKNFDEINLISSPYHMLRASLVFNRIAKETKVHYTPIPKSSFYSHSNRAIDLIKMWHRKIKLHQIKGILHEYLAILYYWWKDYI